MAIGAAVALLAITTHIPTIYWFGSLEPPEEAVRHLRIVYVQIAVRDMSFYVWAHEIVAYIWAALLLSLVAYFQSARDASTVGLSFAITIPAVIVIQEPLYHDAVFTVLGGAIMYGPLALYFPLGAAVLKTGKAMARRLTNKDRS